jgi:hypothetical protein
MKSVLVLYMSRGGHTARIARRICEGVVAAGGRAEMMDINEAVHEGVDWGRYEVIAFGAPVLYGTYDKSVFEFINRHCASLEARPNSFFNVSVVARTPEKATVDGQSLHAEVPATVAVAPAGSQGDRRQGRLSILALARATHDPDDHEVHPRTDRPAHCHRLHRLGRRPRLRGTPAETRLSA